ncbi:MAG: LysR family transcriptional regulator [Nannocystales bacterium]
MRWDDIPVFLAIARDGSMAAAARALKADPSTVSRRLAALEKGLGVQLFDRHAGGFRLNRAGLEFKEFALQMEQSALDVALHFSGRDAQPRGRVRLAAPRHMGPVLLPLLASFRELHPEVRCDVSFSDSVTDLLRHEADVALRISARPSPTLVGRRVARWALATYASKDYAKKITEGEAVEWVGVPGADEQTPPAWVQDVSSCARLGFVVDGLHATAVAAACGMGLVRLPIHLGDAHPELVRVGQPFVSEEKDPYCLWLLTHERLRNAARVRVLVDHLWDTLTARRDRFEGTTTSS